MENDIQKDDKKLEADYEKLMADTSFFNIYENKKKELEVLMKEWEIVQEEIEKS